MDIHFNAYKCRYDLLDFAILPIKRSQIIKSITIYVNLDDLFHTMHKPSINVEFQVAGKDARKQFISNVLNLLGHYRYWGVKHQKVKCRVIGFYTTTIRSFKNNVYIPEYRKHYKEINDEVNAGNYFLNSTISDSIPMIEVISRYIPDVYTINTKYLEPSIIPYYLANNEFSSDWNILISRDTYDIQYAYKDKWSLISPNGENTTIITMENMWDYVNYKERIFSDNIEPFNYPFQLYDLAKAIVGDRYRSIPRLKKIGWKTLFKYFDNVLDKHKDESIVLCRDYLLKTLQDKHLNIEAINKNLNALDVETQCKVMMSLDKEVIHMQIQDIPDYENLKMLNKEQFIMHPINLQFLTDTQSEKKSKYDNPFNL